MDEELLRRLQDRDSGALEQTIRRYDGYVYAIIRNRSAGRLSAEDAEELTSDVFVRLWQHAGEIRGGLRAWLGSVARNRTTDALRRARIDLPLEPQLFWVEDTMWESLAEEERSERLREALNALSPEDREIFCRTYDLCQSSAQIAAAMGIPASTVRTRLSRGRDTIRRQLQTGGWNDETAI